eukprot:scaffold68480_cov45-Prasinocladus_malaysianus.AAC.1
MLASCARLCRGEQSGGERLPAAEFPGARRCSPSKPKSVLEQRLPGTFRLVPVAGLCLYRDARLDHGWHGMPRGFGFQC